MTIDTRTEAELQRYWNPQGGGVEPHDAGRLYLRDDVDAVIAALAAERAALRAEVERLDAALQALEKASSEVSRRGAETGPQWSKLTIAILKARAALKGAANG